MIDLTGRSELAHLLEPIRRVDREAAGRDVRYLIVGAVARDLLLNAVHDVPVGRVTTDIDIAVAVADWPDYEALRSAFPHAAGDPAHRVTLDDAKIDLVPFGGVERQDRTIAWPPAEDTVMSAFGLAEAMTTAEPVRLDGALTIGVASLPAQAVLKLAAWEERHLEKPVHDSVDLRLIMKSYGAPCNVDRLYDGDGLPILDKAEFDLELAGAMLLGADACTIVPALGHPGLRALVRRTTSNTSGLPDDMPGDRDANAKLLDAFREGVERPL